ncbi:hypothetical protein DVH24_025661 [Malus domestica]|uniref:Uncharacterized protein n=1 Tax=Malus domestica TaxID=3750 RepID=A0A498KL84_MALDO|nr:hypothetical protein DVH24_025661 [Malus domestica]
MVVDVVETRILGVLHLFIRKGDYILIEHDVTNDKPSEGADKERIESMFDEKLEMMATKKAILSIELYDLQNHNHHTPLTPSFQCSDHEINVSTSLCHFTSYLPLLKYDLTIKSSDKKSTRFPLENSETGGILLETDYDNIGKLGERHTLSRLCDGASIVDLKLAYHMLITDKGGGPTAFLLTPSPIFFTTTSPIASAIASRCKPPPSALLASTPTLTSSTSLALTGWSSCIGMAIIGTPNLMLSNTELHPQWLTNPPTLGCCNIFACGAQPSTIIPLSPTLSTNHFGNTSSTFVVLSSLGNLITQMKLTLLSSNP